MFRTEKNKIAIDMVRKSAAILRAEPPPILRLLNLLIFAEETQVAEHFLLTFASGLRKVIDKVHFDWSTLPSEIGALLNKNPRCSAANLASLEKFAKQLPSRYDAHAEEAVLVGNGAVLAGLYEDMGAFLASGWEALLSNGICINDAKPKKFNPPLEDWSERIQIGNCWWRKPKPMLLTALLARHVGDPATSPASPVWSHLGIALLVWQNCFTSAEILDIGNKLGCPAEIERGLAIAGQIFPEIERWVNPEKLHIPGWERKLALPIAIGRLMMGEKD
jgi:hypothetical protein